MKLLFPIKLFVFAVWALSLTLKASAADMASTIRVGYLPATHDTLLFIAKGEGLFPKTLIVELTAGRVSPELLEKLKSGAIDVAIPGVAAPINAVAQGAEFCMVGGAARESAAVVVRPELAGAFSGRDTRGVMNAFSGMRVGTLRQSTGDAIFRMNMIGRKDIALVDSYSSPGDLLGDLKSGKLDGAVLWSPHMTTAEDQGIGRIVFWLGDVMPNHVCCRQVVREEYLHANQETVAQYLSGLIRAMYFYSNPANRDKVIQHVGKYVQSKEDAIAKELYGAKPRTTVSVDIDVNGIREYARAMKDANLIRADQEPLVNRSISVTALRRAYEILGLTPAQAEKAVTQGFEHAKVDLGRVIGP